MAHAIPGKKPDACYSCGMEIRFGQRVLTCPNCHKAFCEECYLDFKRCPNCSCRTKHFRTVTFRAPRKSTPSLDALAASTRQEEKRKREQPKEKIEDILRRRDPEYRRKRKDLAETDS